MVERDLSEGTSVCTQSAAEARGPRGPRLAGSSVANTAQLYSTAELSLDLTYLKPFKHSPEDQLDLEVWRASPTSSASTHTHLALLLDNVRHF